MGVSTTTTTPAATTSASYLDEALTSLTSAHFHLGASSGCIDIGSSGELPAFDFEGDSRPMGLGPDIGVDER